MAEIVCPHCHATVPRDGRFCPRCRSLVGSATRDTVRDEVRTTARVGGATTATDVVEEAVRASMATARRESWDVLDELGDERDEPYPSDTEVVRKEEPARPRRRPAETGSRPRTSRPRPSVQQRSAAPLLARAVAWLVALPETLKTAARTLGALPVTVLVVVLALLGSGGLLYGVGAFDERADEPARAAARALVPASYKPSCAAKPSVTAGGDKVTFGADHLVDGRTSTAWRCPGDGSEQQVTLRFDRRVEVTKVALVPGWATKDKTSKADRFAENGAPTAVTWRFDDSSARQTIDEPRPEWAGLTLKAPVTSETVTLTIDSIRKGDRKAMVAVSEIRVYGR